MNDLPLLAKLCSTYIAFVTETNKLGSNYKLKDGTPCFGFIPFHEIGFLLKDLKKIYNCLYKKTGHAPSFMDIGCGIGNMLLLAGMLGYRVTGLEYDLKTYNTAKRLCTVSKKRYCPPTIRPINVIKGDMKKFKDYGSYDVLYYYQPMVDFKAMRKFSTELCKQMKSGAYLISKGTNDLYRDPKGFCGIGKRGIWRKK